MPRGFIGDTIMDDYNISCKSMRNGLWADPLPFSEKAKERVKTE
jgi:hypothetical protein